jgi:hypothetical protein
MINDLDSLVGKYVHIVHAEDYPVFLFNVQEIQPRFDIGYAEIISEQVLDSVNSDDLEVYSGPEYEVDLNNDVVVGVYDTAEELFEAVCKFLKEQIERCSGIKIN